MIATLLLVGAAALAAVGVWYVQRWDDRRIREREAAVALVWAEAMRQIALHALSVSRTFREQLVPAYRDMQGAFVDFMESWARIEQGANVRRAEEFLRDLERRER